MALDKFDEKYVLKPFGLQNIGSICYFNATFQALLSCTSLTKVLLDTSYTNSVIESYKDLLKKSLEKEKNEVLTPYSGIIWNNMMREYKNKNKRSVFGQGSEDANEGFNVLMYTMDFKTINRIFEIRYSIVSECGNCKKTITNEDSTNMLGIDPAELKDISLYEYLMRHITIATKYKCSFCKTETDIIRDHKLVRLSEVIAIYFKKYNKKEVINYPNTLSFNSDECKLNYKLIAEIEHTGGHYYSKVLRDNIYNCDDSSVSPSRFCSTPNTYMIFYHLV